MQFCALLLIYGVSLRQPIKHFDIIKASVPPKKQIENNAHLKAKLRKDILKQIHEIKQEYEIKQLIFTDGSVIPATGSAACAAIVCDATGKISDVGFRLNNWASILQAELFALLVALKIADHTGDSTLIITDSLSSLHALNSYRNDNTGLVSTARHRLNRLFLKDVTTKILWVPSHINLELHDMADALSRSCSHMDTIEYDIGVTTEHVRKVIKKRLSTQAETERNVEQDTSRSIIHHNAMSKTKHIYGSTNRVTRQLDVVTARLRLGYKYYWEYSVSNNAGGTECKLCSQPYSHTLDHYVMICPLIEEFRERIERKTLYSIATSFIEDGILSDILRKHKDFACNR